ncbi:ulp1 protease family, C-terminal catalytic domain-containing protein [Artemisia annua]|uniref:Ulp1 protease family, C-terminal catalytic domain-containing protein n=1 Tax=Artemisia annua TaxID=35608 RepID=A0A2U1PBG4_ARTAN|nr:ulp1 protease family, C-terminal catalytic domain-containing protein [Artemisia annua]
MGTIDLLTEALGTEETRGRVRGMGRFVTPHQYFLIPRNVKQYLKQYDKMMNKRLKAVEDELERRRSASTNASEGASNSPTLSDEDEPPNVPSERNDKSCYLAVDDPSNIVAKGTIVKYTVSVTVDTSVQPEALIPNPIPEEFVETVKDAIGYMLSWPSHLVIPCSGLNKIVAKKKEKKAADQDKCDSQEKRKEEATKRTRQRRRSDDAKNRYLYEQIKNGSQRDHGVCFMTPTAIMHHERKARAKNIEEASRVIAKRLSTRKQNDLILLPYNPGRHWVLGVLNMKTSTCYYLDSLSVSDVNHQFKQIVDAAIALYDVEAGTNKRTKLNWVTSKISVRVFGLRQLIVKHGVRALENDNIGGDSNEYTDADFGDIREEWAIYVSNFIFK